MELIRLDPQIEGPMIVKAQVFEDDRGYFFERFNSREFKKLGIPHSFLQENQSHSYPGVLRGLHFQQEDPQGKLLSVITGKIFDVVVDLRPQSKSFLKWASVNLDSQTHGQVLWIPPGFAHGYCVTGTDVATIVYSVDKLYNAADEKGIIWNDIDLKINWPLKSPKLSKKDEGLSTLKEFRENNQI
jgi:dTDP-4-dehydrorhamnose 3,5-epimerase